ncbi:MAG: hypothetical protein E6Q34_06715 [Burkholderiaceae bacterium]|nr:MAG: hypothetical protein E6Q34_06715 [Burkholderiaceae bacterium]
MQLELLNDFVVPSIEIPPRSKLVSLKPIGVGTTKCEALISYLTRVAGKHVVRPSLLVRDVIIPLTGIRLDTSGFSFNKTYSRTINSYTSYATIFSQALEHLTLQKDLIDLTFSAWKGILDPKGSALLRDHVAFCPQCLDAFEESKEGIYYPLIWFLRSAPICSTHHTRLLERCPRCEKHQLFVAQHPSLGYCTHCGGWLGSSSFCGTKAENPHISRRDEFMTAALEEMIAAGPTISSKATQQQFVDQLKYFCNAANNGNMNRFERCLGFNKGVICNWADNRSKPRIDLFLELCYRLQSTPLEFLSGEIPNDLADQISNYPLVQKSKRVKRSEAEMERIKNLLMASLDSDAAPTQKSMAAQLGVNRRFLNHNFPELARAISDKHKRVSAISASAKREERIAKAKEIVQKMLTSQQPISRRKMWAELAKNGLTFADPVIRQAIRGVLDEYHKTSRTQA